MKSLLHLARKRPSTFLGNCSPGELLQEKGFTCTTTGQTQATPKYSLVILRNTSKLLFSMTVVRARPPQARGDQSWLMLNIPQILGWLLTLRVLPNPTCNCSTPESHVFSYHARVHDTTLVLVCRTVTRRELRAAVEPGPQHCRSSGLTATVSPFPDPSAVRVKASSQGITNTVNCI